MPRCFLTNPQLERSPIPRPSRRSKAPPRSILPCSGCSHEYHFLSAAPQGQNNLAQRFSAGYTEHLQQSAGGTTQALSTGHAKKWLLQCFKRCKKEKAQPRLATPKSHAVSQNQRGVLRPKRDAIADGVLNCLFAPYVRHVGEIALRIRCLQINGRRDLATTHRD